MADRKSVISIDIEDSRWKRFTAEFGKFRADSKETAKDMGDAADQSERVAAAKKKIIDAQEKLKKLTKEQRADLEAEAKAKAQVAAEDRKSTEAKQKAWDAERKRYAAMTKARDDARKERAETIKGLKDSAKWTADIARNAASAAFSAAKWVAFSAVASGFGLGGLAGSASDARRTAQGLGIKTGDLRAAGLNFNRYIDAGSALSNISEVQSDPRRSWTLNRVIGRDASGMSAADVLPELLPKLVQQFRGINGNKAVAESTGLTSIVGFEDLRRLSQLSRDELAQTIESYRKDRQALAVDDSTSRGWQDFLVAMRRAGQGIEVTLIKNLQTLTPYLERFASGISKAIDAFVSNGGLQHWIEAVGKALEKVGDYLGSKEFSDDIQSFMNGVHAMAGVLHRLFPDTGATPQASAPPAPKATSTLGAAMNVYRAVWDHVTGKTPLSVQNNNPGNLRIPGSTTGFQKFANENEGIKALARQLQLYETRDGLTTIRGIISKYSPSNENDTAALIANASKRTGFGADQQLDPKSMDQLVKLVVAITKQENGSSNFTESGVRLIIQNQTGGSAQASVAALAQ